MHACLVKTNCYRLCIAFHAEPVGKKKKSSSQSNDSAPTFVKSEAAGSFICVYEGLGLLLFGEGD